jgi:alcohol dehydrogenase
MDGAMKALVYTAPHALSWRDEPDPAPGPGEALLAVEAVGICGSDMHAWHGHDPRRVPPLILGHEAAARVVSGAAAGRRVVMNPLITCMRCDHCLGGRVNLCSERKLVGMNRPGAFAELVTLPERNLIELPAGLSPVAAVLTEPAATSLHALNLAAGILPRPLSEARALVIGGGSIGLFAALWLGAFGCRKIRLGETNKLRRASAAQAARCDVYDPVEGSVPDESGFDLVVDAVGFAATRAAAVRAVAPGGAIVHVGLGEASGGSMSGS